MGTGRRYRSRLGRALTGAFAGAPARALTGLVALLVTALLVGPLLVGLSGCAADGSEGDNGERGGQPAARDSAQVEGTPQAPDGSASVLGPANRAFLDRAATQAVLDQITPAVAQFFNYDFRGFDDHTARIKATLTPEFWTEMEPGLQLVGEMAQTRQMTSEAEVIAVGVRSLQGGTADLLFFVNRTTSEEGKPPESAVSSVIVNANQVGPEWKINGMRVR